MGVVGAGATLQWERCLPCIWPTKVLFLTSHLILRTHQVLNAEPEITLEYYQMCPQTQTQTETGAVGRKKTWWECEMVQLL